MPPRRDAAGLLELARDALLNDLIDSLPEDRRYAARLTANAIAIAARETQADESDSQAELSLLTELYGAQLVAAAGERIDQQLETVNRRLAKDIRVGAFDGACALGVRTLLKSRVCARLRISNPKYLAGWGLD